jgi:hypothetical protein
MFVFTCKELSSSYVCECVIFLEGGALRCASLYLGGEFGSGIGFDSCDGVAELGRVLFGACGRGLVRGRRCVLQRRRLRAQRERERESEREIGEMEKKGKKR